MPLASELLPPELFSGPHHRVQEEVATDGFFFHFTLESSGETRLCVGIEELKRRVGEVEAIAVLGDLRKDELFAEGLKDSIGAPLAAARNIAEDPAAAVKGVPRSIGHVIGKVGSGLGRAARQLGEDGSGESPAGPGGGSGDGAAGETESGRGTEASKAGGLVRKLSGFDKAKFECARQLGVDPYTDNSALQTAMDEVAMAYFSGGLPLKIGVAAVGGSGISRALQATEFVGLPEEIYELDASELDFRDRGMLREMGLPNERIDALFDRDQVIRSVRHRLVTALSEMKVAGRGEVVAALAACDSSWGQHALAEALDLLRERHRHDPYQGLAVHERLPLGLTRDGFLEIPAPVDFVMWNERTADLAGREVMSSLSRRLLLRGSLSGEAERELSSRGWEVVLRPR